MCVVLPVTEELLLNNDIPCHVAVLVRNLVA